MCKDLNKIEEKCFLWLLRACLHLNAVQLYEGVPNTAYFWCIFWLGTPLRELISILVSSRFKELQKTFFLLFSSYQTKKEEKLLKRQKSLKTAKKYFDQLSGAYNTQKLIKIHYNLLCLKILIAIKIKQSIFLDRMIVIVFSSP